MPGFTAAGVHAGIKKGKALDLALLVPDPPARVAGIFTRNRIQSPAVQISRERVRSGTCSAVLINSGNANACTGPQGRRDAEAACAWAADRLAVDPGKVLVASTGVIGVRLPTDRIRKALPGLAGRLRPEGLQEASEAIQTTDRFPKTAWAWARVGKKRVTLFGMAKGAGMISPNLATMLAFFLTDLEAPVPALRSLLKEGAARSFNRINVDGDSSTNDTVLLLASGRAGNAAALPGSPEYRAFASLLFPMMEELAYKIVKDGEGATKVVEIRVQGARTRAEARRLAYRLANSSLVKTSFYGCDPNWGRLMAATGSAGVAVDPARIDISYDRVPLVRKGICSSDRELARTVEVLKQDFFTVTIDLHVGEGVCSVLTSDLTHDYVTLNASYRS